MCILVLLSWNDGGIILIIQYSFSYTDFLITWSTRMSQVHCTWVYHFVKSLFCVLFQWLEEYMIVSNYSGFRLIGIGFCNQKSPV